MEERTPPLTPPRPESVGADQGEGESPPPERTSPSEQPPLTLSRLAQQNGRRIYPDGFERFWAAYPRHASKRGALRKYEATLRKGATPDGLVEDAGRYACYCKAMRTEVRFIMYASTFLGPDEHWREDWAVSGGAPEPALANLQALQ